MNYLEFGSQKKQVSDLVLGTMRISKLDVNQLDYLLDTAKSVGINALDLADIYGRGQCESLLGQVLKRRPDLREHFWVQSKCGIRLEEFTYFDFSKEHILNSVDGILQRLGLEQLDSLLLHRPDALMEPTEVAEAFDLLKSQGKVLDFGVSNHNPMMIELLQNSLKEPLVANQLQLSAAFSPAFDAGFHVNMEEPAPSQQDGSVFEYCRIKDMVIQAWSVFQYGYFEGVFLGSDKYPKLNQVLNRLAREHGVYPATVALAWILRYPAKMQAILGTTQPQRLLEAAEASSIQLSRKEWYEIYLAAGKSLP